MYYFMKITCSQARYDGIFTAVICEIPSGWERQGLGSFVWLRADAYFVFMTHAHLGEARNACNY